MRFIEKINTKGLQISSEIAEDLELGDLTIFLGRSNSGKTRILNFIEGQVTNLLKQRANTKENPYTYEKDKIKFGKNQSMNINEIAFVRYNRPIIPQLNERGTRLHNIGNSLKSIDPNIEDLGNQDIEFLQGHRDLKSQGTGVHSSIHIGNVIFNNEKKIILIDEPENSLFPSGKIQILEDIIKSLGKKQIILATHDPTLINTYLLKKLRKNADEKVVIYTASQNKFSKIDFDEKKVNPEIHAGYLSQTYSTIPVHLFVEGKTDFYTFQALIIKTLLSENNLKFPEILNRIKICYLGGGQWINHIDHLPKAKLFPTAIILDGEYSSDLNNLDKTKFKIITEESDELVNNKTNIFAYSEVKTNIEVIFEGVFNKKFSKPHALAHHIWNSSKDDFDSIDFSKTTDLQNIKKIITWIIEKAKE